MTNTSQEDIKKEFIETWVERAARESEVVDEGDKFMCIWIAFNAWLKDEYSETDSDKTLIERVKQNITLWRLFEELKNNDGYKQLLTELSRYRILDMRDPQNESKIKQYNGSFESLIAVLYQIRCNLFHGRKNIEEKKEYKLVALARKILYKLFNEYAIRYLNIRQGNL